MAGKFKKIGRFYAAIGDGLIGISTIKQVGQLIGTQIGTINNQSSRPLCPACDRGRLFPVGVVNGVDYNHLVGCSLCAHYQSAELNVVDNEELRAQLREKIAPKSEQLARQFRLESRLFYALAAIFFGINVFSLYEGEGLRSLILSALLALCTVKAVVSAFRCWQIKNNRFFEEGLFVRWINAGRFFV